MKSATKVCRQLSVGLAQTSWESSLIRCLLQFWENLYLQITRWYAGQVRVRCFVKMCQMNPGVYSLKLGCTVVGQWYLIRTFPARLKSTFLEVSFSIDKTSRWKSVWLKVSISLEHTVKRLFYQNMIKEAEPRCIGHPLTISKGKSLCIPKGVDLRFRGSNSNFFGKGIWRASVKFSNLILIMLLVCLTKSEN